MGLKANNLEQLEKELRENYHEVVGKYREIKKFRNFNYSYVCDVISRFNRLKKIVDSLPRERAVEIVKELESRAK